MNSKDWINSPEFVSTWRDSFSEAKKYFLAFSDKVYVRSRKEKNRCLRTEILQPYPGIHLLTIDMQPEVAPHTLWFRVWVDQRSQSVYEQLSSIGSPEILGKHAGCSANKAPEPPSWKSYLQKKGIAVVGLYYRLSDLSFLEDESVAGAELRRIGEAFFQWLTSSLSVKPAYRGDNDHKDDRVSASTFLVPDVDLPASGTEGSPQMVFHLRRERNRSLVEAKKAEAMNSNGRLACEACGFDFSLAYGSLGDGFCEIHHKLPLSLCVDTVNTTLEELAVLCSNCHRVIHRSDPMLSVEELSVLVRDNRT